MSLQWPSWSAIDVGSRGGCGEGSLEAGPAMEGVRSNDQGATRVCRKPLGRTRSVEETYRRTEGVLVVSSFSPWGHTKAHGISASASVGLSSAVSSHGWVPGFRWEAKRIQFKRIATTV